MSAAHTPTPWAVDDRREDQRCNVIATVDGMVIASCEDAVMSAHHPRTLSAHITPRSPMSTIAQENRFAIGDRVELIPQPCEFDCIGVIDEITQYPTGHLPTLYRVRRDHPVVTPSLPERTHIYAYENELRAFEPCQAWNESASHIDFEARR